MKISIITVCYNSVSTIRDTFESVLNQTYSDIEYVVVDGISNDGTISIIKEYEQKFNGRMKWISEPDNGLYDAMNKGIKITTGDIVGILNSDDIFFDYTVLEKIRIAFSNSEDICAVYADLYYVYTDNMNIIARKWITGKQKLFKTGWHPAHPALYIKKEIYDKYGLFNLNYKLASDFEIMLRFIDKYKVNIVYLPEVIIKMRLGGKTNKNIKNIFLQNIEIIRAFKENNIDVDLYLYTIRRFVSKIKQYKK